MIPLLWTSTGNLLVHLRTSFLSMIERGVVVSKRGQEPIV